MKYLNLIPLVAILIMASCQSNTNNSKKAEEQTNEISTPSYKNIGALMETAEQNLEKEVKFKGMVQHVCAHSGRRCFLIDENGKMSVRVEAKGDIKGFNRELSGMIIAVTGIMKEKRLTKDFIDEWEAKVKAKQDAEEGGKHCSAEMTNINDMREWMKTNNKDFYSIFYVDGTSYETLD